MDTPVRASNLYLLSSNGLRSLKRRGKIFAAACARDRVYSRGSVGVAAVVVMLRNGGMSWRDVADFWVGCGYSRTYQFWRRNWGHDRCVAVLASSDCVQAASGVLGISLDAL